MKYLLVLGSGCPQCAELMENIHRASGELGLEYELSQVSDPAAVCGFGVKTIPALVVDGAVEVAGRVPTVEELKIVLGQRGR